jgi:hypothetical protein
VAASWDLEAHLNDSVAGTWDTCTTTNDSQTSGWDVFTTAGDTQAASWDVTTQTTDSVAASWDTDATLLQVTDTTAASWDVLATVGDTQAASWDVDTVLNDSVVASWDTEALEPVNDSVAASWDTKDQISNTSAVLYKPSGVKVPTLTPKFLIGVTSDWNGWELSGELQVSTDPTFATQEAWSPVTFTPIYTSVAAKTQVSAGGALTDGVTYYWRARMGYGAVWSAWSAAKTFEVDLAYGTGRNYGFFSDVVVGTPMPELWFVYPNTVEPGSTATAYGTGFGPTTCLVQLGDTEIVPDSWTLIAGTSDEFTTDRVIQDDPPVVDLTHYEVVFTVPADTEVEYNTTVQIKGE